MYFARRFLCIVRYQQRNTVGTSRSLLPHCNSNSLPDAPLQLVSTNSRSKSFADDYSELETGNITGLKKIGVSQKVAAVDASIQPDGFERAPAVKRFQLPHTNHAGVRRCYRSSLTVSFHRPFARRLASTRRPFFVFIRARKP